MTAPGGPFSSTPGIYSGLVTGWTAAWSHLWNEPQSWPLDQLLLTLGHLTYNVYKGYPEEKEKVFELLNELGRRAWIRDLRMLDTDAMDIIESAVKEASIEDISAVGSYGSALQKLMNFEKTSEYPSINRSY